MDAPFRFLRKGGSSSSGTALLGAFLWEAGSDGKGRHLRDQESGGRRVRALFREGWVSPVAIPSEGPPVGLCFIFSSGGGALGVESRDGRAWPECLTVEVGGPHSHWAYSEREVLA